MRLDTGAVKKIKLVMTVGDFIFNKKYLRNLEKYYGQNVQDMSIKNRIAICKEIERITKIQCSILEPIKEIS